MGHVKMVTCTSSFSAVPVCDIKLALQKLSDFTYKTGASLSKPDPVCDPCGGPPEVIVQKEKRTKVLVY
jgi:hypothetical protein